MKRVTMLAVLAGLLLPAVGRAEDPAPLVLEAKIPLGAVAGRIDHFAFDPDRQLLFVAELGNDSVGMVDVKERKVLRRLSGLSEPQGVAYHPATSTLYVANAGDGSLRLFQAPDFAPLGSIALGADADNIRLDPWRNRIIVGYGKGGLAVIDPASRRKIADMPLDGHPESFQFDETGSRIFVNVPDASRIAGLDAVSGRQVSILESAGARSNFAMAVDADQHRVIIAFRNPARLVVFGTDTGERVASLETCRDADDVHLQNLPRRQDNEANMTDITASDARPAAPSRGVPFGEAMKVWARVAALSFGGPAGQIAVMHRIIVEEKRWIGEQRFLQTLNYCHLLPGPEAQQLAIYIGWLMHKTKGGLFAGTLFVLPGLLAIMALSWIYVLLGKVTIVQGLFFGLKGAVLVIVVEAVLRVGRRALRNNTMRALAAAAFIALFFYDVPFPIVVVTAGLVGYIGGRAGVPAFLPGGGHGKAGDKQLADADSLLGEETPTHALPNLRWSLSVAAVFLALWLVPVAALYLGLGGDNVFTKIAVFFSQAAVVSFGGAYAVLAYVAQQAVNTYHWVTPGEMLDGLGMAETTPGPLIMVTQFVGFLAAWRAPGALPPLLAATLGGLLTTWVTFVPCFLWIFFGAPFVEVLRANKALAAALAAITAAVVGVILNLAVWFALHVLFAKQAPVHWLGASVDLPVLSSVAAPSLILALAAAVAIFRFELGMIPVLLASSLAGIAYFLVAGQP